MDNIVIFKPDNEPLTGMIERTKQMIIEEAENKASGSDGSYEKIVIENPVMERI